MMRLLLVCLALAVAVTAHNAHAPMARIPSQIAINPTATIQVNQTMLAVSGLWVSVSWENIPEPNVNDTIMVFTSDVDFTTHVPVKFKRASQAERSHLTTGAGSTLFKMINMRISYIIVFVHNDTVVAQTKPIEFANYNEPLHPHLATTPDPTMMRFMWVTKDTDHPVVLWGTKPGNYDSAVDAVSYTYTADMLCGPPATDIGWIQPGQIHEAVISGLKSGQKYFYIFGDKKFGFSSERFFYGVQTNASETVNFLTFGDMGKGEVDHSDEMLNMPPALNTTNNLIREIGTQKFDAVMHIGDIAYAMGYASGWDEFFNQIDPVASYLPYMVCPGNHEFDYLDKFLFPGTDSHGECGVPYMQRWHMPTPPKANWYSLNIGPVHWVMMNTEENFRPNSPQYNFLAADLKNVNRKVTPWIVFAGHRPMYIDSTNFSPIGGDQVVAFALREALEPLLYQYKVDLALWGHHHSYQRSCPVYNLTCVPDGPTHLVIGMAGAGLSTNLLDPKPTWMPIADASHFGYSKFSASPTHLHFQFINNDGTELDAFTMTKQVSK